MSENERKLNLSRRSMLAATGAGLSVALGGCSGGGDDDENESEDPEPDNETDPGQDEQDDQDDQDEQDDQDDQEDQEPPDPEATETSVIEPATLKEWHDAGLVNTETLDDQKRVVILRAWDTENYEDGHVPGALKWNSDEFHAERLEGLANAAPMVPDGEQMDEMLQRNGVCPKTTIVISGPSALRTARGYWTLRYWGFPRERVKILNGGYSAYGEEYELAEGGEPDAPTANFSVQANGELNNDQRLGIAQMIQRVDLKHEGERNDVFLDNRPDPSATIDTAVVDNPVNYHEGDSWNASFADGGHWKSADDIESHMNSLEGIGDADEIVSYCGSGYRATMGYVALDAILGRDNALVYDGSFSRQWAHYDGNNSEGNVPPDEWRVDKFQRTDGDTGDSNLEIVVDEIPSLESAGANQLEQADIEYMNGGSSGDDSGDSGESGSSGGGGDWGCSSVGTAVGD